MRRGPVVMISLEEYTAIEETLHLLRSPKNASRLHAAIADLEKGRGVRRDLPERKG